MPWRMYQVRKTHYGKWNVSEWLTAATRDQLFQKAEAKIESHPPKKEGVWYGFLERATALRYAELSNPSLPGRLERYDP